MTDAAPTQGAKPDTKLDARILQLILKGQLKETSSVADSDSGEAVLLADHPHFSKVLHLARVNRSLGILKNVSWWASREPEWSNSLGNKPIAQVLFDTSRQHATGFLTIIDGERGKVVASSAGLTVCVGSNLKRDHLDAVIVADQGVTQEAMDEAKGHAESNNRCLEWALMDKGLLDVEDLLGYYEHQAHNRLFDLFEWTSGEIGFHLDDRAAQLENVVNMPLMGLLRTGTWKGRNLSSARLRDLCAPLIEHPEPLRLSQPIGTLKFGLTEIEAIVVAAAKNHAKGTELVVDLERIGPEALVEGMRFLYLFTQIGVIGVEGPEHAQPILEELGDSEAEAEASPDFGEMMLPIMGVGDDAAAGEAGKGKRRMTGPVGAAATAPKPERRMTGSTQIKEYRLQLQLESEARRLLNAGQFAEAVAKFKQLIERQDRPVQALAYLSVAALLTGTPEGRNNCLDYSKRALELDKESALAHAARGRVLMTLGQPGGERHEKRALALSQYNDSWFLEVKGLLEVGAPKSKKKSEGSPGLVAVILTLLVCGGLFVASNILGVGKSEYFYSGDDWFFYARRGGLLLFGLLGLKLATRAPFKTFLKELRFNFVAGATLFALIWGFLVGFMSPNQRVEGQIAVVLGLTLLHVFAEEVFFRGFVTRALIDQFGDWQRAIPLSALIFAAYHLTFYSFWAETELMPKFYWCAVIAVFAGLPYAVLYHKTKGITAPLVCHLAVNLVMMSRSLFGF